MLQLVMSMDKKTTLVIVLLLMALAIIPVMNAIDGDVSTTTIPVSVCDGAGNFTDAFSEGEDIYVQADGGALSPNAWYLVWVQNCELSPGVLNPSEDPTGAIEFVHTNGNGSLDHTLIWENSTIGGNYTVVLDGGEFGNYNGTEKQCAFEVTWQ